MLSLKQSEESKEKKNRSKRTKKKRYIINKKKIINAKAKRVKKYL